MALSRFTFPYKNSTNLINIGKNDFVYRHGVLDYKGNTEINKFLLPSFKNSKIF